MIHPTDPDRRRHAESDASRILWATLDHQSSISWDTDLEHFEDRLLRKAMAYLSEEAQAGDIGSAFRVLACVYPELANSALVAQSGLIIEGDGNFQGSTKLVRLPDHLKVKGDLILARCGAFVSLPKGLVVEGNLDMRECGSWDGKIPLHCTLRGLIFSDNFPHGLEAHEWR